MTIEKIVMDKERDGFSAVYRSDTTRALDIAFGLDGTPLTMEEKMRKTWSYGPMSQSQELVEEFVRLAHDFGYFSGYKLEEYIEGQVWPGSLDSPLRESAEENTRKAISDGLLQTYEHEGVTVIEPSRMYADLMPFLKDEQT